jgi:hypothetical protein
MHGGGHWVVITGVDKGNVRIMDPSAGLRVIPAGDWTAGWHDRDAEGKAFVRYGIAVGGPTSSSSTESRLLEMSRRDAEDLFNAGLPLPPDAAAQYPDLVQAAAARITPAPLVVGPPAPLAPEAAIAFFRNLVPTLGIDPFRFGMDQRRTAFTLAQATDTELLGRVQDVISTALRTGERFRDSVESIEELLSAAGVSSNNPQYADMVFRTNYMGASNQGLYDEMRQPDVAAVTRALRDAGLAWAAVGRLAHEASEVVRTVRPPAP